MMRAPSKPTPGTLTIVLQFALLTGVLCGVAGGLFGRQQSRARPSVIKEIANPSPAAVPPSPLSDETATYRFYGPGRKYRVEFQEVANADEPYTHNNRIFLIHEKTKRTLWKGTVSYVSDVFWSEDGRAAAIVDYGADNPIPKHRMLVWREGERMHEFRSRDFLKCEEVEDLLWSPNKQSLLLRDSYGMGDQTVCALWHVRLPSGRARLLSPSTVRMEWLSNDKVRYWTREIRLEGEQGSSGWSRVDTHIGVHEQRLP